MKQERPPGCPSGRVVLRCRGVRPARRPSPPSARRPASRPEAPGRGSRRAALTAGVPWPASRSGHAGGDQGVVERLLRASGVQAAVPHAARAPRHGNLPRPATARRGLGVRIGRARGAAGVSHREVASPWWPGAASTRRPRGAKRPRPWPAPFGRSSRTRPCQHGGGSVPAHPKVGRRGPGGTALRGRHRGSDVPTRALRQPAATPTRAGATPRVG